jgi:hypothetical protein
MYQLGQVGTVALPTPDAHVERIQRQIGVQILCQLPADDPAGEHVEHERRVHPPRIGSHIRDVGNPQTVRGGRGELAVDQVGPAVRRGGPDCGPRHPHPRDPTQASRFHEPTHGAPGHPVAADAALPAQLRPHFPDAVHPVVLLMHTRDRRNDLGVPDRPGRGRPRLGGVVGARGDRNIGVFQHRTDRLDPELMLVPVDIVQD